MIMYGRLILFLAILLATVASDARTVVVDAATGEPVACASVFNSRGTMLGVCSGKGVVPAVAYDSYPLTIRCMGFRDATGIGPRDSVVRLVSLPFELPEVVVDPRKDQVLHLLAFVRDYSTLSTYSDTITLFREKWVDFMLPSPRVRHFRGWREPRVLTASSCYRFTDANGLDSVSDRCNHHFSWSDWIGIPYRIRMPESLKQSAEAADTVCGKYSPAVIWSRRGDEVTLWTDLLADSVGRSLTPGLALFFSNPSLDFENVRVSYEFSNVVADTICPQDIARIACDVESRGRGRGMFFFNRRDEPFFVTTHTEIYFIDKEYISVREARQWEKHDLKGIDLDLAPPAGSVPEIPPEMARLVRRVEAIDHDALRLGLEPDSRLGGLSLVPMTRTQKVLKRIKDMLGIRSRKR